MRPAQIVLLALLFAASVANSNPDDPATEVIVTVSTTRFDPSIVEIRRGVRLTFHSLADLPGGLTVVAADGSFESWPLGRHGQWSHRFTTVGTFEYLVKQQPEIRGRAIVK